jgi:hypothetical protein
LNPQVQVRSYFRQTVLCGGSFLLAGIGAAARTAWAAPVTGIEQRQAVESALHSGSDPPPPGPRVAPRIANYTIDVELIPAAKRLEATLVLEWRNTTGAALSEFPFHLYWNAFKNNLSEVSRGETRRPKIRRARRQERDRQWGYQQIRSITLLGTGSETDLMPTFQYLHPDGDNAEDQTVAQVRTPAPIGPGQTLRLKLAWTARIPYGDTARSGWVHDYFFLAQWFPKIGVYWKGAWNCHTFHPTSEFFADFGVYRVRITTPAQFVVGATGALQSQRRGRDRWTGEFYQEDVHDFAWTASPRFRVYRDRFSDPPLRPVAITLLVQPEHEYLAQRYLAATKHTLHYYGSWYGEYPYAQITVVDPAFGSGSGGMEYPTLFTGGASIFDPLPLQSPESVTVHECGHQFWYGLVANNEFEEAWLDEGFNTYSTIKVLDRAYGARGWAERYFGGQDFSTRTGYPIVAPGVWIKRGEDRVPSLRESGTVDRMAQRAWEYRNRESYGLNSYGKPALVLQTLENLLGDATMTRVMRTYHQRYRFGHPTTEDFVATVEQVTGAPWRWFFQQTFFSSELCDYAVERVSNRPRRVLEGYRDRPGREPELAGGAAPDRKDGPFDSEVLVVRKGGVQLPVAVLVEFGDGHRINESWDGRKRWMRYRYQRPSKVQRAVVDPQHQLMIDVDYANNSWVAAPGAARQAAIQWAGRWLLWLQNLLELYAVFS